MSNPTTPIIITNDLPDDVIIDSSQSVTTDTKSDDLGCNPLVIYLTSQEKIIAHVLERTETGLTVQVPIEIIDLGTAEPVSYPVSYRVWAPHTNTNAKIFLPGTSIVAVMAPMPSVAAQYERTMIQIVVASLRATLDKAERRSESSIVDEDVPTDDIVGAPPKRAAALEGDGGLGKDGKNVSWIREGSLVSYPDDLFYTMPVAGDPSLPN